MRNELRTFFFPSEKLNGQHDSSLLLTDTFGSIKYGRTFFITGIGILATVNYYQYLKDKKILKVEVSKISDVKDYIYHRSKVQGRRGEQSLSLCRKIVNTVLFFWKLLTNT